MAKVRAETRPRRRTLWLTGGVMAVGLTIGSVMMAAPASAASNDCVGPYCGQWQVEYTGGLPLRVRSGPGLGYGAVDKLSPGATVNATFECENDSSPVHGDTTWDFIGTVNGVNHWISDYYTNSPISANARIGVSCEG